VEQVAWNEARTRMVTVEGSRARVWDTQSGRLLFVLSGDMGMLSYAVWSGDGTRIVTANYNGKAWVWDAVSGTQLALLTGHTDMLRGTLLARALPPQARTAQHESGMPL
jgi:WD40 repeat protein